MTTGNNIPLHKRVHWRRIKQILKEISEYEKINLADYDLEHITCYETVGNNLKGKTVSSSATYKESIWVSNNHYEIFEVPSKSNHEKFNFCGNFIFLAYNTSKKYWLFGTLTDHIDYIKTKETLEVVENVKYNPFGQYSIVSGDDVMITKTVQGKQVNYGHTFNSNRQFDSFGNRKYNFSKLSNADVLGKILGNFNKQDSAISKGKVKIYKKKNRPSK